jgi:hypothetical protein
MPRVVVAGPLALALIAVVVEPALAPRETRAQSPAPVAAVYGGRTSQAHPMSFTITRSGTGLRDLFTRIDTGTCTTSRTFNVGFDVQRRLGVRISRRGGFATTMPVKGPAATGERLDLRLRFAGSIGRQRASGTMRLTGAIRDAAGNETDRCDSELLHWSLRRGDTYGGRLDTASHGSLTITVDAARQSIKSFLIDVPVVCGSTTYRFTLEHLNIPIRRSGAFSRRRVSGLRLEGPDGSTVSGRYSLRGEVGPRRASGTYRAVGSVRMRNGGTARCDSETIPWAAARG